MLVMAEIFNSWSFVVVLVPAVVSDVNDFESRVRDCSHTSLELFFKEGNIIMESCILYCRALIFGRLAIDGFACRSDV